MKKTMLKTLSGLLKKRKVPAFIGAGTLITLLFAQSASAHILVIGSKRSGVRHMTPTQISSIYMGMPSSLSGQFKPYDQPSYSQAYLEFCKKVLHRTPDQMSSFWASQTFKGLGSAPSKLSSIGELLSLIAGYPSVIGYIDSSQVSSSDLQGVRILYQEPGYGHHQAVKHMVHAPAPIKKQKPQVIAKKKSTVLSKEQAPGLWGEVLSQNHWGDFHNHTGVQTQINKFKVDGDLQSRVENATPYLGYVYSEAKKMGIPAQFALLPLMESNYNPKATNRNGAGLWQLERATAKYMNVPVNNNYDGRRDVAESTHAALQHLRDEFNRFHNWQLATAAYNCGTGPVEEAVKRNRAEGKPTNFWAIRSQLPHITQAYVPRLIALSYMLNHANHYGLKLANLPTDPTVDVVPVKQGLSLNKISDLSGASIKQLKQLNPGLLNGKTPADVDYQLILPANLAGEFQDNLSSMNEQHSIELSNKKQKQVALVAAKKAELAAVEAKKQEQALAAKKAREVHASKELTPYQVTPAVPKEQATRDNLKSLLSKIYDH